MESGSWSARIISDQELIDTVKQGDSFGEKLKQALNNAGYANSDTIFCDFVFDGSKAGSYYAYRKIEDELKSVQADYKYLYVSETDLSTGE